MANNPKTTDFLKDCMAEALVKLMEKKPFEKITIDEIAEEAGVHRSTWFRNFTSKNEAIIQKLVKSWYRWGEARGISTETRYIPENALDFFAFNYSIRPLLYLLYREGLCSEIYEAFYRIMRSQAAEGIEECYGVRFYSNGMFGLLLEWIRRDFKETPQEMASMFARMLERDGNILLRGTNAQA